MNLFPNSCIICQNLTKNPINLCTDCEQELPWQGIICSQCGEDLDCATGIEQICGRCLQTPPPFNSCHSLFRYGDVVRDLISGFKYRHQFTEGAVLAKLLAREFASYYKNCSMPQLVLPVPLHRKKLALRGYNQSAELARVIARQCNLELDVSSCRRHKATVAQQGLDARSRKANVKNAFELSGSGKLAAVKSVAIIDDVVTTTATVWELSVLLKGAGIETIEVWCVARASVQS